jgi:hypothetical protein
MTILHDVLTQYSLFLEAEGKYVSKLSRTAAQLADGLEKYLAGAAVGRRDEIVRLGIGTEFNFRKVEWTELTCTEKVIDFSLAIKLTDPSDYGNTTEVVFQMAVRADDNVYTFGLKNMGGQIKISDVEVQGGRFGPVYEAIVTRLKAQFDPGYYALG